MTISPNFIRLFIVFFFLTILVGNTEGAIVPSITSGAWSFTTRTAVPHPLIYSQINTSTIPFLGGGDYIAQDDWGIGLSANTHYPTSGATSWTFTAVIAGRSVGDMNNGGNNLSGINLGFITYDANFNVQSFNAPVSFTPLKGTFGWVKVSITYLVQPGIVYLQPRIWTNGNCGGGEVFVNNVSLTAGTGSDPSIVVPIAPIPNSMLNLPAVYNPTDVTTLTWPWNGWQINGNNQVSGTLINTEYKIPANNIPKYIALRDYNANDQIEITIPDSRAIVVQAGQTWTFSAIVSGRSVGDLTNSNGMNLIIMTYDSNNGKNWVAASSLSIKGTFGWKVLSVTYTIPANIRKIQPRIWSSGGGEIFLHDASLLPMSTINPTFVAPNAPIPKSMFNLPAIFNPTDVTPLTNPWNGWQVDGGNQVSGPIINTEYKSTTASNPISYIALRDYNPNDQMEFTIPDGDAIPVKPGQTWTFSAIIAGRCVGDMTNGSGVNLVIMTYDQNNLKNWNTISSSYNKGTFPWRVVSLSYTIPTGVNKIQPRIWATGGGEVFLNNASLLPMGSVNPTYTAPIGPIPVSSLNIPAVYNPVAVQPIPFIFNGLKINGGLKTSGSLINILYNNIGTPFDDKKGAPFIELTDYNSNEDMEITTPDEAAISVQEGQWWTFSAIVAGRCVGDMLNSEGLKLMILTYDAANTKNWTAKASIGVKGTFNYKVMSVSYQIPAGVKKIQPRIWAKGGGEIFLNDASLLPMNGVNPTYVAPNDWLPKSTFNISPILNSPQTNDYLYNYSPNNWSNTSNSYLSDNSNPRLQIINNNQDGWQTSPSPFYYKVKPNIPYVVTAQGMGLGMSGQVLMVVKEYATNSVNSPVLNQTSIAFNTASVSNFNWIQKDIFLTPSNNYISVEFSQATGGGEFNLTNVRLLPMSTSPVYPPVPSGATTFPLITGWSNADKALPTNYSMVCQGDISMFCRTETLKDNSGNSVPYIALQSYNNGFFILKDSAFKKNHFYQVKQGEKWVFSAVVGSRFAGKIMNGSHNLRIRNFSSLDYSTGLGTLVGSSYKVISNDPSEKPWQIVSCSLTVPAGVKFIAADFFCNGGGELFVSSAAVYPENIPATLTIPIASLPPSGPIEGKFESEKARLMHLNIVTNRLYNLYNPSDTINWTISPATGGFSSWLTNAPTINYEIRDVYGVVLKNGQTQLGTTISYIPLETGYYEMLVSGNFSDLILEGKSGISVGLVASNPDKATTDFLDNSNPFGIMEINKEKYETLYSKLGMTWDRCTVFNIENCGHNSYTNDAKVDTLWINVVNNGGDISCDEAYNLFDAKFSKTVEYFNEPGIAGLLKDDAVERYKTHYEKNKATQTAMDNACKAKSKVLLKKMVNFEHPQMFTKYVSSSPNSDALTTFDILSIHPYVQTAWNGMLTGPEAKVTSKTFYDAWGKSFKQDYGNYGIISFIDDLAEYRRIANGKPLWTTEFGWSTNTKASPSAASEILQAKFTVRASLIQLAEGVQKIMPYKFRDRTKYYSDAEGFGLVRTDSSCKPSLQAYSIMAQLIHNLPYAGYINYGIGSNVGYLLFGDATKNKTVAVLWHPGSDSYSLSSNNIGLPSSAYNTYNMYGGKITNLTTISTSPTYLVISNASPATVANQIDKTNTRYVPVTSGYLPSNIFNVTQ